MFKLGGGGWNLMSPSPTPTPTPPKKNRRRGYIKVQAAIFNLFTACMVFFFIEADQMLLGHSKYSNTFSITIPEYTRMQNQMHD